MWPGRPTAGKPGSESGLVVWCLFKKKQTEKALVTVEKARLFVHPHRTADGFFFRRRHHMQGRGRKSNEFPSKQVGRRRLYASDNNANESTVVK